jgi:hypothetical protein
MGVIKGKTIMVKFSDIKLDTYFLIGNTPYYKLSQNYVMNLEINSLQKMAQDSLIITSGDWDLATIQDFLKAYFETSLRHLPKNVQETLSELIVDKTRRLPSFFRQFLKSVDRMPGNIKKIFEKKFREEKLETKHEQDGKILDQRS